MQKLNQLDSRWAHLTIGKTRYTIGRWGCTITSLCMVLSRFYPESWPIPPDAANKWAFNDNAEIIWTLCDFGGMRFVKRGYGYNAQEIKTYAENKEKGVILQVNNSHWVAVAGVEDSKLIVHDPIDGTRSVGVPKKYAVTGYALFEKVEQKISVSPHAEASVAKVVKSGVATGWNSPKSMVANSEAELILMRLAQKNVAMQKAFTRTEPQGGITKEDFVVLLDRLGFVD